MNEESGPFSMWRLLATQRFPFVNEFPEKSYQGLVARCMCVWDYVLKHMFAGRGRHSQGLEKETEECLLGTAAGVSVILFLLSRIVIGVGIRA